MRTVGKHFVGYVCDSAIAVDLIGLSLIAGLDTSNISRRRYDAAQQKLKTDRKFAHAEDLVEKRYQSENRRRDPNSRPS